MVQSWEYRPGAGYQPTIIVALNSEAVFIDLWETLHREQAGLPHMPCFYVYERGYTIVGVGDSVYPLLPLYIHMLKKGEDVKILVSEERLDVKKRDLGRELSINKALLKPCPQISHDYFIRTAQYSGL